MRTPLIVALVAILLIPGAWVAQAQDETPEPAEQAQESPFQVVEVDGYAYPVDPFYPCVAFVTERVTRLDPEQETVTTITLQPFVRDGDQMTALEPFTTDEGQLTADVAVGQALTCVPQVAVEDEETEGLDG